MTPPKDQAPGLVARLRIKGRTEGEMSSHTYHRHSVERIEAADRIEQLEADNADLRAEVLRLQRFVPQSVVECRGDKCREPWCASCFGWDDAEAYVAALTEQANIRSPVQSEIKERFDPR